MFLESTYRNARCCPVLRQTEFFNFSFTLFTFIDLEHGAFFCLHSTDVFDSYMIVFQSFFSQKINITSSVNIRHGLLRIDSDGLGTIFQAKSGSTQKRR